MSTSGELSTSGEFEVRIRDLSGEITNKLSYNTDRVNVLTIKEDICLSSSNIRHVNQVHLVLEDQAVSENEDAENNTEDLDENTDFDRETDRSNADLDDSQMLTLSPDGLDLHMLVSQAESRLFILFKEKFVILDSKKRVLQYL